MLLFRGPILRQHPRTGKLSKSDIRAYSERYAEKRMLSCGFIYPKTTKRNVALAGLLTYPAHRRLPVMQSDSDIMSMSFVGITVAGLFRILTGFPINRVVTNQNVRQIYRFF